MREHRDDPRYTPTPTSSQQPRKANAVVIPRTLTTSLSSQIVLSEEAYTKALSEIIKRDFFPDLKKADELSASINNWRGSGATPSTSTPSHKPQDNLEYDYSKLSLHEFQSRFTSEDNASFSYQLHKANMKRREVYRWAYDAELLANERLLGNGARMRQQIEDVHQVLQRGEQRLLEAGVESVGEYGGEGNTQALVRREKASNREVELGVEKRGKEDTLVPTSKQDDRSAAVHTWGFTAANNLMFGPDANKPSYVQNVDREAENRTRRVTNYAATRMLEKGEDDGKSGTGSVASTAINAAINAAPSDGTSAAHLPSVRGYGFVESMPSPQAHQLPSSELNRLMVSGTLASTPKRLDKEDETEWDNGGLAVSCLVLTLTLTQAGEFKIPRLSRRDRLGQQLASQAQSQGSARSAAGHVAGSGGATPKTPRGVALSPAGHALLEKTKRRRVGATATPSSLKQSSSRISQSPDIRRKDKAWTPTPKRR